MIVDIEKAITFYAKINDLETIKTLRLLQSQGVEELTIDIDDYSSEEEESDDESMSDLESEEEYDMIEESTDDDDGFEVVEENISVTFKDGFYSLN